MQNDLEILQPRLKEAAGETEQMLAIIEKETAEVEIASKMVRNDEKVANIQAGAATQLKNECEAELALAIPILEG
jgi:dynein heavy chain